MSVIIKGQASRDIGGVWAFVLQFLFLDMLVAFRWVGDVSIRLVGVAVDDI